MELYVLIGLSYAMADCKMYISNNYSNCGQRYGPVGLVWTPINTNISMFQCSNDSDCEIAIPELRVAPVHEGDVVEQLPAQRQLPVQLRVRERGAPALAVAVQLTQDTLGHHGLVADLGDIARNLSFSRYISDFRKDITHLL